MCTPRIKIVPSSTSSSENRLVLCCVLRSYLWQSSLSSWFDGCFFCLYSACSYDSIQSVMMCHNSLLFTGDIKCLVTVYSLWRCVTTVCYLSSWKTSSQCKVWGNRSTGTALVIVNAGPSRRSSSGCGWQRLTMSRTASPSGLQETYTMRLIPLQRRRARTDFGALNKKTIFRQQTFFRFN